MLDSSHARTSVASRTTGPSVRRRVQVESLRVDGARVVAARRDQVTRGHHRKLARPDRECRDGLPIKICRNHIGELPRQKSRIRFSVRKKRSR